MSVIGLEDFLSYRMLSSLSLSPDGRYALFAVAQARKEENDYAWKLHLYDFQTSQEREIDGTEGVKGFCFSGPSNIVFPLIKEEDDRAYTAKGGYLTVFHEMNIETGELRELFRVPLFSADIRRVSDGLYLLSSVRNNMRPDIESMDKEEQEKAFRELEDEKAFEVCDEIPFVSDGRGFINGKRKSLYLYDLEKGGLSEITGPYFETSLSAISRDGRYIAYSGAEYQRMYIRCHGIYLYDVAEGRTRTLLTPGSYQVMGLDFLSDSLAVAASPWNGYGSFPNHGLYTLSLDGELVLQHSHVDEDFGSKTCSDCRIGSSTVFRCVGDDLYYMTTCGTDSFVNRFRPGSKPERLNSAAITPCGFAASADKIAAVATSSGLQELFLLDGEDGVQLTGLNDEALRGRYVGRPQKHAFVNSDGFEVSGFVIEPYGYEKGRKYPGILEIHGGPRASFSRTFFHEMQYLAGKGYFVFFCNPRGSSGSGEAFADINSGKRGTVDFQDVMDWTDYVLKLYPDIDSTNLAVMGGSYGGYLTNWCITHTKRFKAAVSMRSISDVTGSFGATDFGIWGTPGVYGGDPWSNAHLLREQSPFTYAMNVSTPTLFLHSFEDYRCALSGAWQMYSALQIKGVPTRMCLFRNSCHELSRSGKPKSRIRRLEEIGAWVDRFLR